MLFERLMAAYDAVDDESAWSSFVAAVIAEVRGAGTESSEAESFLESAGRLLSEGGGEDDYTSLRVAIWRYLDDKNGSSTVIRDVDDRALRALLTVLMGPTPGARDDVEEAAWWVASLLAGLSA
ncbi:hypothetical protein [Actinocatenispora rupis]|uniref:Uncharacterized protein n=1 Tax=Actinocatenispora rupis TaxID=519421 RepID=A0A8J3J4P2_9ACTN|nr:hypothetical protein [Actinocatenispora rupis]GID14108.1 hypothetical protein Aru02nite_49970 [Actinocatenispora rupis]